MLFIGPLWFIRAGSKFGVHFFESADCIASIVDFVAGVLCLEYYALGVVRCDGRELRYLFTGSLVCFRRFGVAAAKVYAPARVGRVAAEGTVVLAEQRVSV